MTISKKDLQLFIGSNTHKRPDNISDNSDSALSPLMNYMSDDAMEDSSDDGA